MSTPLVGDNLTRFIEWCDLGPALGHAMAAGMSLASLCGICFDTPHNGGVGSLRFNAPEGGVKTFTNEGER